MSNYSLKEQIKSLNSDIIYYHKKANSLQEKINNFQKMEEKYHGIEYYGGKIFYISNPSLAKKITFVAGNLGNIDYKKNHIQLLHV